MEVFVSPNCWIPVKIPVCMSFKVEDLQMPDKRAKIPTFSLFCWRIYETL
jgi:hypothetical protein